MSGYADIDLHLHAVYGKQVLFAPSLRLRLLYNMALEDTASLDVKRGDWRELGDGIGDARPIFDRKLLRQARGSWPSIACASAATCRAGVAPGVLF
jgi:hypothetical protein